MQNIDANTRFYKQVGLLLRILPEVMEEECFALKGGTAINMFLREMPRLSVDIDLCYLPIEDRNTTLTNIDFSLKSIARRIQNIHKNVTVQTESISGEKIIRLNVYDGLTTIKIETNYIIRGSVRSCINLDLCENAQETFNIFRNTRCLSIDDLYGGKICAALDRQHPRDLFDIKLLLEREGITDNIRQAFVVYLASHNRPIGELINPNRLDFKATYKGEFQGMTNIYTSYQELVDVREDLINTLLKDLTNNERYFLLSIKKGNPDWSLLPIEQISNLPGIRWKLMNIKNIDPSKHEILVENLKRKLMI